jgi:6-phosphofructokinase 1
MTTKEVANLIQRGGTTLRSARLPEFKELEVQKQAVSNVEKHGLEGLVVIGGDGSLTGAKALYVNHGIPVVGIPGSIDNDIYGTDLSIGVDTALNTIINAIDMVNDTASSHERTFLIEVMGRHSGYLAVTAAITAGAEAVLIPEVKINLEQLIEKIKVRYKQGKTRSIILVAEGAGNAYDYAQAFKLIGGFDTRITVLGHLQRGGSPLYFDRMMATRMGKSAVDSLMNGTYGVMMGLQNTEIVPVPLVEVLNNKKQLDPKLLELAEVLT